MVAIMSGNQSSSAIKRADRGSIEASPDLPLEKKLKEVRDNMHIQGERPEDLHALSHKSAATTSGQSSYLNDSYETRIRILEREKRRNVQDDEDFQDQPIVLHPDMIDEDTEEELDYEVSGFSQSKQVGGESHEDRLPFDSMSDDCNNDNDNALDVVTDPWAAVASLVDPGNAAEQVDDFRTQKRSTRRKSKDSLVQRFHKSRLNSSRNRRSSTGSKSSNKSSWSASSQSSSSVTRKRGRPPKLKPPVLFCYRCSLPFNSFAEWREHAVYKHIAAKDPYPIVEMNYIDPSRLRSGITLVGPLRLRYSHAEDKVASEGNIASDEDVDVPMSTLQVEKPDSSDIFSDQVLLQQSLPDLSKCSPNNSNFSSANTEIVTDSFSKAANSPNSDESEHPKEQLKLRFSMNKKAGTYVVRQSSVESKSPLSETANDYDSNSSPPLLSPEAPEISDSTHMSTSDPMFNNNVVIKNSNICGMPELEVHENVPHREPCATEVSNSTSLLEARLTNTNRSPNSSKSISVIIRRNSNVDKSINNNQTEDQWQIDRVVHDDKTTNNHFVLSEEVEDCLDEILNIASQEHLLDTNTKNGDQDIEKHVVDCVEDIIEQTKSIQQAAEDAQIQKDVSELVEDVIRQTKEAEQKADQIILEDVIECVGDVVQKTVSIEAELDDLLGDDYEAMLEKATELSRRGSPFHSSCATAFPATKDVPEKPQQAQKVDDISSDNQDMISKGISIPSINTTPLKPPEISNAHEFLMADCDESSKDSAHDRSPAAPPVIDDDEDKSNDSDALKIACDEDSETERLETRVREIDQSQSVTSKECEHEKKDNQGEINEINHSALIIASSEDINSNDKDEDDSKAKESEEVDNLSAASKTTEVLPDDDDENDFQCHVCNKNFESDDEVSRHFSKEHIRIISVEPESPFPGASEVDDDEGLNAPNLPDNVNQSVEQQSRNLTVQESEFTNRSNSSDALTELLLQRNNVPANPRPSQIPQHSFTIQRGGVVIHNQLRESGEYHPVQRTVPTQQQQQNRLFQQAQMALAAEMRAAPTSSQPGIMVGFQRPGNPIQNRPTLVPSPNIVGTGARLPQLTQRPVLSQRTPSPPDNYNASLRNALTGGQNQQVYSNPSLSIGRTPQMSQGNIAPRPQLRTAVAPNNNPSYTHHHQPNPSPRYPLDIQGQVSLTAREPSRPNNFNQIINQQQRILNEEREQQRRREAAQRLLLQQQRITGPTSASILSSQMGRLQSSQFSQANKPNSAQQQQQQQQQQRGDVNDRVQIITRTTGQPQLVISGQKRPSSGETMENIDSRPNKQPRVDNQTSSGVSPEITISHRVIPGTNTTITSGLSSTTPAQSNQDSGVHSSSVRIGSSITLSVCPGDDTRSRQSAIRSNPAVENSVVRSSNPQNASVLAVRGVTVSSHSPPIQSKSPVAVNPSPSHSPVAAASQNYSGVIQRGPGTVSPQRNPSPPVNMPNRGVTHNFAVPRAPTTMHPSRGPTPYQAQQQAGGNSTYSINTTVDRPNRPPTVDLTSDDIQAHQNSQNMALRMHEMQSQIAMEQRRLMHQQNVQAQANNPNNPAYRGPRPALCMLCNSNFPSTQALEEHKISYHGVNPAHLRNPNPNLPAGIRPNPNSGIQIREVRSINPQMAAGAVRAPPPPHSATVSALLRSQSQPRSTNSPTRPVQQQSAPRSATPPGKYFYIPLLDLSRVDETKMRKLEEIGISCVVPLQGGNNLMSHMGIPVMNIRNETNLFSQHIPWDSVIPMGPVHQPANSNSGPGPGGNSNSNPPRPSEREGSYHQQISNRQQQQYPQQTSPQISPQLSIPTQNINTSGTATGNNNINNNMNNNNSRIIITRPTSYHQ